MLHVLIAIALCGCGPEPVKAPVPASASAPCFPGKPAIAAATMYERLEKYSWSVYSDVEAPPPTTYGACKVVRNVVSAPDGAVVAELGCGVRILANGIYDDLGLEIGARGQDVLDRKPEPVPGLRCFGNGPQQGRCIFDRPADRDTDSTMYVVDGALGDAVLTGDDAKRYFARHTIVEIEYSVWCH